MRGGFLFVFITLTKFTEFYLVVSSFFLKTKRLKGKELTLENIRQCEIKAL